jgi:hypothetical protein
MEGTVATARNMIDSKCWLAAGRIANRGHGDDAAEPPNVAGENRSLSSDRHRGHHAKASSAMVLAIEKETTNRREMRRV